MVSWVDRCIAKAQRNGTMPEYLRRNQLHAASVGANANAKEAARRVKRWKRPPKWLVELLAGIVDRTARVQKEMAAHRDEVYPLGR